MANEITMRVYEQGQGTVLNGGGSGTIIDRGAGFDIPISGLAVGTHTLEVTAEDTAASKAESTRVSTGQFTIDAAGYSDDFAGAADTPLATHNSNWVAAVGQDVGDWELDGSGHVRLTAIYHDNAAVRHSASSSDISQVKLMAQSSATDEIRGVLLRAGATDAYMIRLQGNSGGNFVNCFIHAWVASRGIGANFQTSYTGSRTVDHTLRAVATTVGDHVSIEVIIDGSPHTTTEDHDAARLLSGNPGLINDSKDSADNGTLDDWRDW